MCDNQSPPLVAISVKSPPPKEFNWIYIQKIVSFSPVQKIPEYTIFFKKLKEKNKST